MPFETFQQRLQAAANPITEPTSVVAPITGWNTRDALDAMDPTDAVILDNWYPDAGGCTLRNGYQSFATGVSSADVQTLAEYAPVGGTNKFFAAGGTAIYDISSGGVASSVVTGQANAKWQTANFKGNLFLVNGVDTPLTYDGSSFADSAWTGVDGGENLLIGIFPYEQRLYAWKAADTGFYYAGLNAITGAMTFFDLSMLSSLGGTLTAVTSISYDGGNGVVDYIVFIMSSGDAFVFQGNDPGDSSNFFLVGRYRLSPPVNVRAVCHYGGETYYTTNDDHVPFQQQFAALRSGQVPPRSKVSGAVAAAVAANSSGFGWQGLYYPKGRRLIFNIPNADGTFDQHVYNTANQSWCRFKDMNGSCWGLYKNDLYFGGASGTVYKADTGNMDVLGAIQGDGQQAWNALGSSARKRATAIRPIIQSARGVTYSFGVNWDYNPIAVSVAAATETSGSPWDTSPWNTSPWSAESQINVSWRIGGGTGQSIGWRLKVSGLQSIQWLRTDLRYETGNGL